MDNPVRYMFKRERKFNYVEHKNLSRYPKEEQNVMPVNGPESY